MRKPYQLAGLASFFLAVAISLTLAQTSTTTTPPPQAPAQSQGGSTGNASQDRAQAQGEDENPLNLTDEQRQKLRPIIADETRHMDAARNDSSLTQEQKVTKINQIRDEASRSEEHTSELQSPCNLVCRLLLEKKKDPQAATGQRSSGL